MNPLGYYKRLAMELRSIQSRSKQAILLRAAQAIEDLLALKEENEALIHALHCGAVDCDLCIRSGVLECGDEVDCDACTRDCICNRCSESDLQFKWNGKRYERPVFRAAAETEGADADHHG